MLLKMTNCRDDAEKFNIYDIAAAMFDETARMFADTDSDRTKIPEIRKNLEYILGMLRALDIAGMAEDTDSLPMSDEIQCFDYQRLGMLIEDMGERYFPTQEVFDAA